MRNQRALKYTLLLLLVAAGAVVARFGFAQSRQPETPSRAVEKQIALRDALRTGGLEAAAKVAGNYVADLDPNPDWLNLGIEALTKNSEAVVIGVPLRNRGMLTTDGSSAVTQYEVAVREVLKGQIEQGATIAVALPGGKVSFPDGTTAEIRTPEFRKMVNSKTYLLYLSTAGDDRNVYHLTAGSQGLLELLEGSNEVRSHAAENRLIREQIRGKGAEEFLKDARRQAKEWPRPARCCR